MPVSSFARRESDARLRAQELFAKFRLQMNPGSSNTAASGPDPSWRTYDQPLDRRPDRITQLDDRANRRAAIVWTSGNRACTIVPGLMIKAGRRAAR